MRSVRFVLLGLLVGALCMLPASAADDTIRVKFLDPEGQVLSGRGLTVVAGDLTQRLMPDADSVYHLRNMGGKKVELSLSGPRDGFAPKATRLPLAATEILEIRVEPKPVVALFLGADLPLGYAGAPLSYPELADLSPMAGG